MPSALLIPSQSHSFASVSFTPQMMQVYSAALEATVEQSARFGLHETTGTLGPRAQCSHTAPLVSG